MLLTLMSPVILVIAFLMRYNLGKPVLFCQSRPGLHGKIFKMIKFRTMKDSLDKYGMSLPDSQRMTRLGQFLRATSLDELPELWSVIKGEMSIVGPRPLLVEYFPLLKKKIPLVTIVHPAATVSRYAVVEQGSVGFAGAVMIPDSRCSIIITRATMEHGCDSEEAVHISPGVNLTKIKY